MRIQYTLNDEYTMKCLFEICVNLYLNLKSCKIEGDSLLEYSTV
jgi:hypothetical protein